MSLNKLYAISGFRVNSDNASQCKKNGRGMKIIFYAYKPSLIDEFQTKFQPPEIKIYYYHYLFSILNRINFISSPHF